MSFSFRTSSLGLAGAALLFATMAAQATGSISCTGVDDDTVSADIGFGTLPVLHVVSLYVTAGGERFSLNPQSGETEVIKGDGAFLDDGLIARFTDPNVTQVLIELRILSKSEAKSDASVGILTLPGSEAFALSCIGP